MLKGAQHLKPVLLSVPDYLSGLGLDPCFFPQHFAALQELLPRV